jgi:carbamoyltransferase
MNILGLSCYFHDAAAALLRDGELVAAAEEERFSRIKHDFGFPSRAIDFCLQRGGLAPRDLDYVAFFEKPFLKFERILQTTFATVPRSQGVFRQAMTAWLLDKLWVKSKIRSATGIAEDRILFVDHHASHASSAFFCSPFTDSAILTVDGVGEWATATMGAGRDTKIALDQEIRFPHSLGLLYSAFTAFLGFEVNEGEYKVMGMAPYGTPRFVDKVWKLVKMGRDGSFELNLEYFSFPYSTSKTFSPKFETLFGPARKPETPFFTADTPYPAYYDAKPPDYDAQSRENQKYADLAASIQVVTEEILLAMARGVCERAQTTRLCMAGGVALNSVANARILRETPVTDLYVQPAAGDSGAALGAALFVHHQVLGQPRRFVMRHAYWGESHGPDAIRSATRANGMSNFKSIAFDDEEALLDRVVGLLTDGRVIGWAQGAFEWGPRALGHRSILADPRLPSMKDVVNTKIKFREPYRPFAPSVLQECAPAYFALDDGDAKRQLPAHFMLLVVPVRDQARDKVPAVTHVDRTARVQVVTRESNARYYRLIEKFGQATGVPVLLNTSFNLRGEPIVNTPAEALSTWSRSGMDALVLDRTIVFKDGMG